MIVIATTADGCLISATTAEVKAIITSVNGTAPKDILIGQKLPAIDYASSIAKVKALNDDFDYKALFKRLDGLNRSADALKDAVNAAANIEA